MNQDTKIKRQFVFLTLFLMGTVLVAGGLFFWQQAVERYRSAEQALTSIADLKADEIAHWMSERRGDATVVQSSRIVRQLLMSPGEPAAQTAVLEYFDMLRKAYHYKAISIFDSNGSQLLASPDDNRYPHTCLPAHVQWGLNAGDVEVIDLHGGGPMEPIHFILMCPIKNEAHAGLQTIGLVLMVIDPYQFLYPFVQSWPTSSPTAETLLVRREGGEVLYLNDLRHRKNAALNMRLPESHEDVPAVRATTLGERGVMKGVDYRGVPVLAVACAVSGTSWIMIAKMDQAEIDASVYRDVWTIWLITALTAIAALLGSALLWRQQRLAYAQREMAALAQAERALRESEARARAMLSAIPDMMFRVTRDGVFLDYKADQKDLHARDGSTLRGECRRDLMPEDFSDMISRNILSTLESDAIQTFEFQVTLSADSGVRQYEARMKASGTDEVIAIVRDITEQKHAAEKLRSSEERFKAVFQGSADGILLADPAARRFRHCNAAICRMLEYSAEELTTLGMEDIHRSEDLPWLLEAFQEQVEGRLQLVRNVPVLRKDGSLLYADINTNMIFVEGRTYAVGFFRDVTERNLTERFDRILFELARVLSACHDLAAGLRHCLSAAVEAAGGDSGGLYLMDDTGGLDLIVHEGLSQKFVQCASRYDAGSDRAKLVMEGTPVYALFGEMGPDLPAELMQEGLRLLAVVPLRHGDQTIGCLNVASHTQEDLSPHLRRFLEIIADNACAAVMRLKAEQALHASEQKYRGIFDESVAAIYVFDTHKRFIDSNEAGLDLLGYTRGELLSMSIPDVDTDRDVVLPAHAELLSGGRLVNYEHQLKRKDGSIITVLNNSRALTGPEGSVTGIQSTLFDITARKHAEEQIKQSENRYRQLFELTYDGIVLADMEGHTMAANQAYCELTGRSLDWLLESRLGDCEAETSRALVPERVKTLELEGQAGFDVEIIRPDGTLSLSEVKARLVDWFGRKALLGVVRDITARKQMEEDLRSRNEELARFVYTVSHDLKSPLVTIQTFLGYLAKDMASNDGERVKADLGYIDRAAVKMHDLLEGLLELSRVGRKMNPPEDLPFVELVHAALDTVAGQVAERRVEIRLNEVSVLLHGDRLRLAEVFQNLIENAVKFMGDQPEPLVEIGVDTTGAEPVFYVRDNGMGFDPRHRGKLFGLFEKLHPGTPGTGMGLALIKRIVEVHGGRIWADSAGPGQGTTFCFTLEGTKSC